MSSDSESNSSSSSGSESSSEEEVTQQVVAKTKKRKAPAKAAKEKPKIKRALSAYMFFSKEQRPLLKAGNPELGFGDIGKLVGKNWRNLSDAEKKPYQKLTDLDKLRYEKEKKEHPELVGTTKKNGKAKAVKKKQYGPKKPLTSYMFYMQKERPSVIADHPDFKFSEIGKEVGKRWKDLDASEKAVYQKEAEEAKTQYKIDFAQWKEDFPEEFAEMQEQKKKPKAKGPAAKKQKVVTDPQSASGSDSSDSSSGSESESDSD